MSWTSSKYKVHGTLHFNKIREVMITIKRTSFKAQLSYLKIKLQNTRGIIQTCSLVEKLKKP